MPYGDMRVGALRVWWRTFGYIQRNGYIIVWACLCAAILSIPLITLPAAWAGLVRLSHTALTMPSANLHDFWAGFREQLGRGVILALLNVVVVGINVINLLSYSGQTSALSYVLRGVWIAVLVAWFSVQLYLFPFWYEMESPTLGGALRNAALMALANPGFTLLLWVGIVPLAALSTYFPALWLLLTPGLFAALATVAVLNRLGASGYVNPAHRPPDEPPDPIPES
ncbi:MAG: hypothetical protein SGI73_12120 [Chloroflexota bacterium]|nr:hypothetical protein [Chloroflexota bacterium]